MPVEQNMLGAYGEWAAGLLGDGPARLSFRQPEFRDLEVWRTQARARYHAALMRPVSGGVPQATLQHRFEYDGLEIEHLTWQLPYGPPTQAYLLKPAGATGKLPGVVGLHDHGGNKYFGVRKITKVSKTQHPLMQAHQEHYYGGAAWANELAKRGYVVLVHDTFTFGSRRVRVGDLAERIVRDLKEEKPESEEEIKAYNAFAGNHEHIVAKSLFCAGTTWPGVFVSDDQRALDVLCARPEVDPERVGCCGLSGGGLRTVYLTGADDRIRCSCAVGMMTTWRDYLLHKSHTHTWMVYLPGLPPQLDYPEIYGLNAPRPILALNNNQDQLFTLPEMQRADEILKAVYAKAGAADRYKASFHDGPHKFDREMQTEAFAWFDRWLRNA
jgi:dienelactone hydrolase